MKIGYYPGCSLQGSSKEFDESVRAVCEAIGLELVEVPDWQCCGASSAHMLNRDLSLALPARILAQAEAAGLTEVLAPCAACYSRMATAHFELEEHPEEKKRISEIIEIAYTGKVKVLNILEVLDRHRDAISKKVTQPFVHKVACYYGCLLVRPPKVVSFDRPENPQSLDRMMEAVGAKPIEWNFKTECCGGSFSLTRTDIVAKMSGRILQDAVKREAEVIVVACPMCQINLDLRRPEINAAMGANYQIPVMYLTQILGLAMGIDSEKLGLQRHMVPIVLSEPKAAASVNG